MAGRRVYMLLAVIVLLAFVLTAMVPTVATASAQGRKNTAIGLSAVSVYELIRGHTGTGLVLGAGSAYAWHRYSQAKKQPKR